METTTTTTKKTTTKKGVQSSARKEKISAEPQVTEIQDEEMSESSPSSSQQSQQQTTTMQKKEKRTKKKGDKIVANMEEVIEETVARTPTRTTTTTTVTSSSHSNGSNGVPLTPLSKLLNMSHNTPISSPSRTSISRLKEKEELTILTNKLSVIMAAMEERNSENAKLRRDLGTLTTSSSESITTLRMRLEEANTRIANEQKAKAELIGELDRSQGESRNKEDAWRIDAANFQQKMDDTINAITQENTQQLLTLRNEITKKLLEIESLKNDIKLLNSDLLTRGKESEEKSRRLLEAEYTRMKAKEDELRLMLAQRDDDVRNLKIEMKEKEKIVTTYIKEVSELRQKVEASERQYEDMTDSIAREWETRVAEAIETQSLRMVTFEENERSFAEERETWRTHRELTMQQIEDLNVRNSELSDRISDMLGDIRTRDATIQSLQADLEETKKGNRRLSAEIKKKDGTIIFLQDDINQKESKFHTYQSQISELNRKVMVTSAVEADIPINIEIDRLHNVIDQFERSVTRDRKRPRPTLEEEDQHLASGGSFTQTQTTETTSSSSSSSSHLKSHNGDTNMLEASHLSSSSALSAIPVPMALNTVQLSSIDAANECIKLKVNGDHDQGVSITGWKIIVTKPDGAKLGFSFPDSVAPMKGLMFVKLTTGRQRPQNVATPDNEFYWARTGIWENAEGTTVKLVSPTEDIQTVVTLPSSVEHLNYAVMERESLFKSKERIDILHDVSFYLKPGMMVLLLAGPGAGKTSLFKCLTNRIPKRGLIEGDILFDGHPIDPKTHHTETIYASQIDNHLPTLTVKETLDFSIQCQSNLMPAAKVELSETILDMLGMRHVEETIIGNTTLRGISGGQKKRMTVAVELVKGAKTIFMDEPTTGLDSTTSFDLLNSIKMISQTANVPAMVSLLQPSPEIFSLFTHVLMLRDGHVTFFGTKEQVFPFYQQHGMTCPTSQNPAEYLASIYELPKKDPSLLLKSTDDFVTAYHDSMVLKSLILGLLIGSLFYDIGHTQKSTQLLPSLTFFLLTFVVFGSLAGVQQLFLERPIFYDQKYGSQILLAKGIEASASHKLDAVYILIVMYAFFCVLSLVGLARITFNSVSNGRTSKKQVGKPPGVPASDPPVVQLDSQEMFQMDPVKREHYRRSSSGSITMKKHIQSGCYLTFAGLSYRVIVEKKNGERVERTLLDNVNGVVAPGTLLALMGASGAGKSTLLDILANRKDTGAITGDILLNGRPRDKYYQRYIAYVEQEDVLPAMQTVKEAISFAAALRLDPSEISESERQDIVCYILDALELESLANTLIGRPGQGLSAEQRKRVNIGIELTANPDILFLDEPTTGLDASSAERIMRLVKKLTESGRQGGYTVYFGELGQASSTVLSYCRAAGHAYPGDQAPADFLLDYAAKIELDSRLKAHAQHLGDTLMSRVKMALSPKDSSAPTSFDIEATRHLSTMPLNKDVIDWYNQSDQLVTTKQTIAAGLPEGFQTKEYNQRHASSFFKQSRLLAHRSLVITLRKRNLVIARLIRSLLMSFITGTLYLNIANDQEGVIDRISFIFFTSTFASIACLSNIPSIFEERTLYYREVDSGTYRHLTFGLTLILTDLPFTFCYSALFSIPVFWLSGLNIHNNNFVFFVFVYYIYLQLLIGFSQLLGFISASMSVANEISGIAFSIFSLFAGFIIRQEYIPSYFKFLYHISFTKYLVEALTINEMKDGITFYCTEKQFIYVPVKVNSTTTIIKSFCPIEDGSTVLYAFGLDSDDRNSNVGIMITLLFGLAFLTLVSTRVFKYKK
eukprot:gene19841-23766_t